MKLMVSIRAGLLLFIFIVGASAMATAGTDELEALLKKSLDQAKAAGAKYDNQACGHYFSAEGEYDRKSPDGQSVHDPISRHGIEPWGCNEKPNDVQVTEKFESRETQYVNGDTVQYLVNAYGVYSFDRSPSTEIAGTVVDKNNKPVKNAEVRAEDVNLNKPAFTTHTDEQGKYSLKVNSGQYRVSAKAKDCKAEQTLWACSWGKILAASSHKERFPLDLVANCNSDRDLEISGVASTVINANLEGVHIKSDHGTVPVSGSIPLSLDAQTGQITGDGTMHFQPSKIKTSGAMPKALTMSGSGSVGAEDWQLKVHGTLDTHSNIASLTCECTEMSSRETQGNVTVKGAHRSVSQGGTYMLSPEKCDWQVTLSMPWEEGASQHIDRHQTESQQGVVYDRHEVLDFTLGDGKDKQDNKKDDGTSAPPSSGKDTQTDTSSGTNKGARSGGSVPVPPADNTPVKNKKLPQKPSVGLKKNIPIPNSQRTKGGESDGSADENVDATGDDAASAEEMRSAIKNMKLPPQIQEQLPEQFQNIMQQLEQQ